MLRGMSVLLVEDNVTDVLLMTRHFAKALGEVQIHVAETLETALFRLRKRQVDTVLLDLGLPDADKDEALTRIRSDYPELDIIVVTSDERSETPKRVEALGANDYLRKSEVCGHVLRNAIRRSAERVDANRRNNWRHRTG